MSRPEWHSVKSLARALGRDAELLLHLAAARSEHYRPFTLTRGTKERRIDNPDRSLKFVQTAIRKRFLVALKLPDHVHGCVRGRSPLSNAHVHKGLPNIASVDIKNFYPNVTSHTIWMLWRRLGFGPRLAQLLTELSTFEDHLPQGAPTSDALANHTLAGVDARLQAIADALGLALSRYLDNIDLSGERTQEAIPLVIAAIRQEGFAVRHKKTFNAGPRAPHIVTGYTVNNPLTPSVARREQRRIRFAVHELIRAKETGCDCVAIAKSLHGRLLHLRRTNPGAAWGLDRQLIAARINLRTLAFKSDRRSRRRFVQPFVDDRS